MEGLEFPFAPPLNEVDMNIPKLFSQNIPKFPNTSNMNIRPPNEVVLRPSRIG